MSVKLKETIRVQEVFTLGFSHIKDLEIPIISWSSGMNVNKAYYTKFAALLDVVLPSKVIAITRGTSPHPFKSEVLVRFNTESYAPNLRSILQLDFSSDRSIYTSNGDVFERLLAPDSIQATTLFRMLREGVVHETWLSSLSRDKEISNTELETHTLSLRPFILKALHHDVRTGLLDRGIIYTNDLSIFGAEDPLKAEALSINWGFYVTELLNRLFYTTPVPKIVLSSDNHNPSKLTASRVYTASDFFDPFSIGEYSLHIDEDMVTVKERIGTYECEKHIFFLRGSEQVKDTLDFINSGVASVSLNRFFFYLGNSLRKMMSSSENKKITSST